MMTIMEIITQKCLIHYRVCVYVHIEREVFFVCFTDVCLQPSEMLACHQRR